MKQIGTPQFDSLVRQRMRARSRPAALGLIEASRPRSAVQSVHYADLMVNAAAVAELAAGRLPTDISFNKRIVSEGRFVQFWQLLWNGGTVQHVLDGWVIFGHTTKEVSFMADHTDYVPPEIITTKGVALGTDKTLYTFEYDGEATSSAAVFNTFDTACRPLLDQYSSITGTDNLSRSTPQELGFGRVRDIGERDSLAANYLYSHYIINLADLAIRADRSLV